MLNIDNWKGVSNRQILAREVHTLIFTSSPLFTRKNNKGGSTLLSRYGTLLKALKATFPELVNVDGICPPPSPSLFSPSLTLLFLPDGILGGARKPDALTAQFGHWAKSDNVRKFLEEVAEEQGFDPYQSRNWDQVKITSIVAKKVRSLLLLSRWCGDSHLCWFREVLQSWRDTRGISSLLPRIPLARCLANHHQGFSLLPCNKTLAYGSSFLEKVFTSKGEERKWAWHVGVGLWSTERRRRHGCRCCVKEVWQSYRKFRGESGRG